MGKRGPPKTPTAELARRGSHRATSRGKVEAKATSSAPSCPMWVHGDGKRLWKRLAPQLEELGLIAEADREAFARYCHTFGQWRTLQKFLAKHGSTYESTTKTGGTRYYRRPESVESAELERVLAKLEGQFGLTPSARSGLAVVATPEKGGKAKDAKDEKLRLIS